MVDLANRPSDSSQSKSKDCKSNSTICLESYKFKTMMSGRVN